MKTKFFAIAAIAATVAFASCNKNEEGGNAPEGQKAKLTINVTAPETRAAGAAVATDAVNNFTAFVFNAAGTLEGKATSADGSALTGANAISVTTNAKSVYVVANVPAAQLTSINTKAALEAYVGDLNAVSGSQTAARFATGKTATDLTFTQSGNDFTASATVSLTFVAARIVLTIENGMTGYNASAVDGSLVLTDVAVMNARGASKLFGTSLIPSAAELTAASYAGKKFYSGIDKATAFTTWPAVADYAVTGTLLKDAIPAGNFTNKYYYYVSENDATTAAQFPTIVTIVGTYDGKTIYFPVHLAPYEQWVAGSDNVTSVTRGKSYNINIKLTGDPTKTGGGDYPGQTGGGEDPTNPTVTAKVSVSVSLTDWVPVTLNKEF